MAKKNHQHEIPICHNSLLSVLRSFACSSRTGTSKYINIECAHNMLLIFVNHFFFVPDTKPQKHQKTKTKKKKTFIYSVAMFNTQISSARMTRNKKKMKYEIKKYLFERKLRCCHSGSFKMFINNFVFLKQEKSPHWNVERNYHQVENE